MLKKNKRSSKISEITDYDLSDTTAMIGQRKQLSNLDFALPDAPASQVVSIRFPTKLLNALKSIGNEKDVPYQSLIKLFLWDRVGRELGH